MKEVIMKAKVNYIIAGTLLGGLSLSSYAVKAVKPNIIFIMTDQQFADAMSCRMGKEFINTPVLDRLAANGILFTRAYTTNPLSMPARSSLFTGRYTHETRVTINAVPEGGMDPKEFVSMGTYFKNAGYETAYFGKWHLTYDEQNIDTHGFENMADTENRTSEMRNGPDARTSEMASKYIAGTHNKPFLLVASFLNPHNICQWARRAAGRDQVLNCGEIGDPPPLEQLPPAPVNLDPPENEPDGMTFIRRAYQVEDGLFPVSKFTPDDWRRQRWGYYRMIELVDAEIGKLMNALQVAGLEENTIIVFTSDHGECAGAHRFNQKTVFYDESARVPLIITWKGKTHTGTSDKMVNTGIDILPTILEFAGIPKPEKLTGLSLVPQALGKTVNNWREYIVVEDNMTQTGEIEGIKPEMEGRMVRTVRYKYCIYSKGIQRESLVDMQNDPGETINLATDPAYKTILLKHRELLRLFGLEQNDVLVEKLLADDVKPIPFFTSKKEM